MVRETEGEQEAFALCEWNSSHTGVTAVVTADMDEKTRL